METTKIYSVLNRISILILLTIFCNGCKTDRSTQANAASNNYDASQYPIGIEIDIKKSVPISKNLKTISTIEFNEDSPEIMGEPQSVVIKEDTIYCIDSHINPGFFAYLKDGRQIFSYCSKGNGPEDISSLFSLNVTDEGLNAFDLGSSSLIFIDKTGKFIKRISLPVSAVDAAIDNDGGIWIDYSNQLYSDTRLTWKADSSSEEKVVLTVPETIKRMTTIGIQNLVNLEDGTINYVPAFEPVIYRLEKGSAIPKYNIDYKGLWPDEETFKTKYATDSWASNIRNFPVLKITVKENNNWLVIGFMNRDDSYVHVFNKTSGIGRTFIDKDNIYYSPEYVESNNLYIQRKDDRMDILDLSGIYK